MVAVDSTDEKGLEAARKTRLDGLTTKGILAAFFEAADTKPLADKPLTLTVEDLPDGEEWEGLPRMSVWWREVADG